MDWLDDVSDLEYENSNRDKDWRRMKDEYYKVCCICDGRCYFTFFKVRLLPRHFGRKRRRLTYSMSAK